MHDTDELFDPELASMVRFQDATQATEKPKATRKAANTTTEEKVAQKPAQKPTKGINAAKDAKWEPVKSDPDWMDSLKACAKVVTMFGALSLLVFYWQQTGQMADSAAIPSLCACCLFAGLGVGKNALWGDR